MLLTLLGRAVSNASIKMMFTDTQFRVLLNLAAEHELPELSDVASVILLAARLGGY
ncbi:MAG: hypothetical protein OXD43_06470 [Bacteroidetes bacterium]|nr:hypothetical protein [Bacteroidota bacterium]